MGFLKIFCSKVNTNSNYFTFYFYSFIEKYIIDSKKKFQRSFESRSNFLYQASFRIEDSKGDESNEQMNEPKAFCLFFFRQVELFIYNFTSMFPAKIRNKVNFPTSWFQPSPHSLFYVEYRLIYRNAGNRKLAVVGKLQAEWKA